MNERAAGPLTGYQLRLPAYEGPLDVLLQLIERNRMSVTDVSLVAVTEQFVAYTSELAYSSTEVLAEFMTIAARLLLLKSRSLLPRPAVVEEAEETDDLVERLREYQQVKLGAEDLRRRERQGVQSWSRLAPPPDATPSEFVARTPVHALINALRRCLSRQVDTPEPYAAVPVISLRAMTQHLLTHLGRGRARFSALIGRSASRSECAVAFIALLSLLRERLVEASQSGLFGEIDIERVSASEHADD